MKIRAVGAELFHADKRTDGQTDMAKFCNFANAPTAIQKMAIKVLTAFSLTTGSRGINRNEVERTY